MSLSMALKETNRKHSGPQQSSNHRKPLPRPLDTVRKTGNTNVVGWQFTTEEKASKATVWPHTSYRSQNDMNPESLCCILKLCFCCLFIYFWQLGSSRTSWKPNQLVKLVWPNVSTFLTLCTPSWDRATWTLNNKFSSFNCALMSICTRKMVPEAVKSLRSLASQQCSGFLTGFLLNTGTYFPSESISKPKLEAQRG